MNNYLAYELQYYIRKSFFKDISLKSEVHLRSNGRLFHSFGAAATKARSQRVEKVLKFGFESKYLLFDLSL